MNVLLLTHRLPYAPNRGDRRRTFHMLRVLSRVMRVHVVSLVHDEAEAARVGELTNLAASVRTARVSARTNLLRGLAALAGSRPLTHALLHAPGLGAAVQEAVSAEQIDAVLCCGSGLAPCAVALRDEGIPFVLDLVDVDSAKWAGYADASRPPMRWVYRREARRLGAFEDEAVRRADATLVVNERERRALSGVCPEAPATVVPNGIDVVKLRSPLAPSPDDTVLFCGVMDYRPNHEAALWLLDDIWPRVAARRPGATLQLAGSSPSRELYMRAAERTDVHITGHLVDIRPCFWNAAVFVAPLRLARGVQNKVLDAAVAGVPSVVTSTVYEGLPAEVREACVVADDAAGIAAAVAALLERSPAERRAMTSGIDFEALTWERQLHALAPMLRAAVEARTADTADTADLEGAA